MSTEPSLLDYLLSIIDPRRERIRLPGLEVEPQKVDPDFSSEPVVLPLVDSQEEHLVQGKFKPLDDEGYSFVAPSLETVSEPSPVERGPLPWRSFAAIVLAIAAQSAFEPPNRFVSMGVFLYAAASVFGVWAVIANDLVYPRLTRVKHKLDALVINRTAIYASMPMIAVAFITLGGNKFTSFNLAIWIAAILLIMIGFRVRPTGNLSISQTLIKRLPPYSFHISSWTVYVAIGAFLVLFFRFYQLDTVPLQMFSDHAEKLQDVQDVLNGQTRIFFPRNTGREFVQMYLTAFTAKYLGYGLSFMALKMGTALAGLVTLPFIYLFGREVANRRVGLLAMVMAGISYWLNVITRVALRFSLYPLFVAPVMYFVVRGLRRGNRNDFIWAGIFLGLGLHGYSPFRFVPLLVVLAVVLYVLHVRSSQKQTQALWYLGVVITVSFVVFLPLLRFMTESESNGALILYRSMTRLTSAEAPLDDNPIKIFANNMWLSMAMFAWENGNTWVHSVVFRPALDIVSGALFYLGYILLLYRYIRQRNWEDIFLILSVPFLMLPSALSLAFPAENPSLNRSGGAIIPVFIIAAMPLDGLFNSIRRWIGSQWGRIAAGSVVGILLLWSCLMNYDLVFRQYNRQFQLSSWNTTELGGVVRAYADSVGSEETAWVIPWPHWVDTRLVGINAEVYIKDYAIQREGIEKTTTVPGTKLFIFHVDDGETRDLLQQIYPDGTSSLYESEIPGKNFMIFFVNSP